MKNDGYYAGHEFQWIQIFLDVTPKGFSQSVAYCVANAIHHQYIYKKSNKFSLPHSIQKRFAVHQRALPRYLEIFQKYELLKFKNSIGNSFEIELLVLPNCTNKNSTKDIKVIKYTGQLVSKDEVGSIKILGNLAPKDEVNLVSKDEVKKRRKEGSKERRKDGLMDGREHRTKGGRK